jgi:FlaA1/EpsC-like NDP-sugar epimerase
VNKESWQLPPAPVRSLFDRLMRPTRLKRFLFFLVSDIAILAFSLYLSFLLRFDFTLKPEYYAMFTAALPVFLVIHLITFKFFKLYKITWSYVGLNDLFNIVAALIVANLALMVLILVPLPSHLKPLSSLHIPGFPRSIFLINSFIGLILLSGLRISKRFFLEVIREKKVPKFGTKTIIIGSGHTGEMIVRDMARQGFSEFYPIGFLDDDAIKQGTYIHGLRVLGPSDALRSVVTKYGVTAVIIAIPSLNHKVLRKIYSAAQESNIKTIKIIPRIYDFHKPHINLKSLEDIRLEDLIGRQVVEINHDEIETFLTGNSILITGAGGSIGSEIAKQICGFSPGRVILLDNDETYLHYMEMTLRKDFPDLRERLLFFAGDIKDKERIDEIFRVFPPHVVFHAAAYKHVPMMEHNVKEAIKVNMLGTYTVAKAARDHHARKFIMISTDKAVMPTSVMGATKRMAENICRAFNDSSSTEFISVRFGNVLASRGSVLPLFLRQLKTGGPLTVTHKDMMRYFMTIPEAVSLVLEASVIGKGGEVLILDMGEPIKIVGMAEDLIRLHGLQPYKDIDIEFIGLRPGEKLFEEILTAEEGTVATKHDKVFIARNSEHYSVDEIEEILNDFDMQLRNVPLEEEGKIKELLKKYVKHYD